MGRLRCLSEKIEETMLQKALPALSDTHHKGGYVMENNNNSGKQSSALSLLRILVLAAGAVWLLSALTDKSFRELMTAVADSILHPGLLIIPIVILSIFLSILLVHQDYDWLSDYYKDKNITLEDIAGTPEALTSKLISICSGKLMPPKEPIAYSEDDVYTRQFDGFMISSKDGSAVDDLLATDFRSITFFFVSSLTNRSYAGKILADQGFIYKDSDDDLIHFSKDDINVYLLYKDRHLCGIEILRGEGVCKLPGLFCDRNS